jgi:hypothetical protein
MVPFDKSVVCRSIKKIVDRFILATIAAFFVGFASIPQKRPPQIETEVKAVFLFNFAQFVEWSPEVLPQADSPIVIGILGKDPFGAYLEETISDELVNGHPLTIKRFSSLKQIARCHILYINPNRSIRIDNVLKVVLGKGILTVSDAGNFAKQGGMIQFIEDDDNVKLRINLNAVKESNISISSKLLSLSEIIE